MVRTNRVAISPITRALALARFFRVYEAEAKWLFKRDARNHKQLASIGSKVEANPHLAWLCEGLGQTSLEKAFRGTNDAAEIERRLRAMTPNGSATAGRFVRAWLDENPDAVALHGELRASHKRGPKVHEPDVSSEQAAERITKLRALRKRAVRVLGRIVDRAARDEDDRAGRMLTMTSRVQGAIVAWINSSIRRASHKP